MSTRPQPTQTESTRTASTPFTTRNAPLVFSPHNTDTCPAMFSEKWTAPDER